MIISVVGNASSILDKNNGALIDSADIVVRCTYGVPTSEESQGKRTDILAAPQIRRGGFPEFTEYGTWWNTRKSRENDELYRVLGYTPSTGIVALEMVKNRFPDALVRVFGFDWKATPTFYKRPAWVKHKETPKGWFNHIEKHDYASERRYCLNLIEEQGWELV